MLKATPNPRRTQDERSARTREALHLATIESLMEVGYANTSTSGIAKRAGHPISFWTFTKYGLMVTAVTISLSLPYVWLRYFA